MELLEIELNRLTNAVEKLEESNRYLERKFTKQRRGRRFGGRFGNIQKRDKRKQKVGTGVPIEDLEIGETKRVAT